ncbi:sulfite exporter TauE/SafE family protein [Paenibacillus flagellatus]|uniref:Probable membrane transporter protein n=1 Tax=Paenibacillus flagellatus TaxID=2211139 RepID=A0A2V5KD29_9BACL|nr:sulfite exporter TauE/SafE family protein [Paenibacillus flagellatus]PYI57569.1 sulfite exporter TauE/SafE family protein [Paenibacillus flagellatus]
MDWGITLLGLLVGFLVGLTGVGGASLLTPILVLVGINPTLAVGTDLFYNSITKLFGTIRHMRQKTVDVKLVLYLAAGSIPGAIVSIVALHLFDSFFHNQEQIVRHALGIMLIVVAVLTIAKQLFDRRGKENRWQAKPLEQKKLLTVSIGLVLGFIVGLTSIGSGSLFAIALLYLYTISPSKLVGTDIAHALLLVTAAGLLHASFGNVDFGLAFQLLLGSVPGVWIGSGLTAKVPAKPLRAIMASLILISGIKLI